ncbi:MAG: hypothetical protein A2Y14_02065 [Verrucomicrobia bacterium GWF2_51_19]|nr:MAG: hypothetical protein A2Y14_02065 [Verrucomicrobia bacterium GWF2_51_19]
MIGSLLCFVPIVNLLAFGYLYRYLKQIRQTHDFSWPRWAEWERLFIEGVYFFLIALAFFAIPMLLGLLTGAIMRHTLLGFALGLFVGAPLFTSALYTFQGNSDWQSLRAVNVIFKRVVAHWAHFIFPSLAFVGFMVLGFPLYGFTFFVGLAILMPYYTLHFEKSGHGH